MELDWKKWFEIGHETIDFEHKVFFSLIHKLQCLTTDNHAADDIRRTMNEIMKYAEFHFVSEENIMIECNYDKLESHVILHRNLLRDLRDAITMHEGGAENDEEIVTFLFNWLLEHTIKADLDISRHVKEKNLRCYFNVGA
ncbi:MAG: hemerythrin domain-containing protein [Magnetospirillum sp. WYHS-4]